MDMTADIRAAFVDILMRQDWMDDKTKKAAKLKVRGSGRVISTIGDLTKIQCEIRVDVERIRDLISFREARCVKI